MAVLIASAAPTAAEFGRLEPHLGQSTPCSDQTWNGPNSRFGRGANPLIALAVPFAKPLFHVRDLRRLRLDDGVTQPLEFCVERSPLALRRFRDRLLMMLDHHFHELNFELRT